MTRFLAVALALVMLLSVATVPVASQSQTITITVSVVNQADNPVAGAELLVEWDGGSTTETTKANGQALVDVPEGANLSIDVTHPSYVRNNPYEVTNVEEGEVTVGVYRRGSITVNTEADGDALADARVIVRKEGEIAANGRTNADGVFDTGVIEQGEYTVTAVKEGYFRNQTDVTVDGTEETSISLESGSVTVTFNATDPHFSPPEPVGGVAIAVEDIGSINTLQNGEATVRVPVNTDRDLEASKQRYETVTRQISIGESDTVIDISISREPAVNLTAINQRVVAGEKVVVRAVDEYGDPIEGATIRLDGNAVGQTDADGEYAVTVESVGDHQLRAQADNLRSDPVTVTAVQERTETPSPTPTETTTEPDSGINVPIPGFTPMTAVLALAAFAAAALLARRRGE